LKSGGICKEQIYLTALLEDAPEPARTMIIFEGLNWFCEAARMLRM
jgi:hypothetical protein